MDSGHSYDDFGAIVAGISSISNAPYANFLGDDRNMASSFYATVIGGIGNTASNTASHVSGGSYNTASGQISSISGGDNRSVSGTYDWRAGLVSGTVSGLSNSGMQTELLSSGQVETIDLLKNGGFVFKQNIAEGESWTTTLLSLPNNPGQQSCIAINSSG